MPTYIALLRGINVSGQKKIKMADLRTHLSELAYADIRTYIQSGNIVFSSPLREIPVLEAQIVEKIQEKYGFDVPVMIREPKDFTSVLERNPMPAERYDHKRLYATFLDEEPASEKLQKLAEVDYSPEEYIVDGRMIYFYSPHGYGRAKMNNNFFEQKLKVKATTRNWNTVNKLLVMSQES